MVAAVQVVSIGAGATKFFVSFGRRRRWCSSCYNQFYVHAFHIIRFRGSYIYFNEEKYQKAKRTAPGPPQVFQLTETLYERRTRIFRAQNIILSSEQASRMAGFVCCMKEKSS